MLKCCRMPCRGQLDPNMTPTWPCLGPPEGPSDLYFAIVFEHFMFRIFLILSGLLSPPGAQHRPHMGPKKAPKSAQTWIASERKAPQKEALIRWSQTISTRLSLVKFIKAQSSYAWLCLQQYCRSIAAVLPQYCRSTVAVLPYYCCCIAAVLPQCCRSAATVLINN